MMVTMRLGAKVRVLLHTVDTYVCQVKGRRNYSRWLVDGLSGLTQYLCISDRMTVKRAYEDALSVGPKGNGEPGPRRGCKPDYFAAYFHDLVGNNVEVSTWNAE